MRRKITFVLTGVLLFLASISGSAHALDLLANSTINWRVMDAWTGYYTGNAMGGGFGPTPTDLNGGYDYRTSDYLGNQTRTQIGISTSLGQGIPQVGLINITGSAYSSGGNLYGAGANAHGGLTFYFTPIQIKDLPDANINVSDLILDIYFQANATIEISGTGRSGGYGFAQVNLQGYNNTELINWSVDETAGSTNWGESYSASDGFNRYTTIEATLNTIYYGVMQASGSLTAAGCGPYNCPGASGSTMAGSSSLFVNIDPIIRFNQAAFDARYGANSFNLEEYFRIDFSSNIPAQPVPVPSSIFLIAPSLVGLIGFLRKRLNR